MILKVGDVHDAIARAVVDLAGSGKDATRDAIGAEVRRTLGTRPHESLLSNGIAAVVEDGRVAVLRRRRGSVGALYGPGGVEVASQDADAAPDFGKVGYPSAGERIGPAWRAMWAALADGEWHDAAELARVGSEAGRCLPKTARELLYPAARERHVETETRYDTDARRWRSWCRRAR